jgi:hypothetical protein
MAGFGIGIATGSQGNGSFNTGIDLAVSVIDNFGNIIDLGGEVLDFQYIPAKHDIEVSPISNNGEPDFRDIPNGGSGTITIQRYYGSLESEQAAQEALFHSVGGFKRYFITRRSRNNANGLVDVMQFQRCTLWLEDPGSWKVQDGVPIKVSFKYSRGIDVSLNYAT